MLALLYALAGLAAAVPAVVWWRRRRSGPVAGPLVLLYAGIAWWCWADALSVAAADPVLSYAFDLALYPGTCMVVGGFLWQSLTIAGRVERPTRRRVALFCVVPALTVLAAATDPWHGLFYDSARLLPGSPMLVVDPGPLFWLHTAYCYTLSTVACVVVVRTMRAAVEGVRRTYRYVLLAASVPTVGNLVTVFVSGSERPPFDLTPFCFLVTAASWWYLERRWGTSLNFVPLSARQVLEAFGDAAMVIDPLGRLIDANPAAQRLLAEVAQVPEGDTDGPLGRPWRQLLAPELAAVLDTDRPATVRTGTGLVLDVRVTEVSAPSGSPLGCVVVVRDVTELERLRADLAEQASRDGLTRVHNRRHLDGVLAAEVPRAVAAGTALSVLMLDVDHFKRVNDTLGHARGDELLVLLAHELEASLRGADVVARYGGEEFVVVMVGTSAAAAADRAEAWRATCAETLGVTISAGIAELRAGDTPDTLLRRADVALYRAKAGGRDRVVVADRPLPDRPLVERAPALAGPAPADRDPADATAGAHHRTG